MTGTVAHVRVRPVEVLDGGFYRVTGGAAPHLVRLVPNEECDCASYRWRPRPCVHIQAVRALLGTRPVTASAPVVREAAGPGLERDVPLPDPT